MKTLAIARELAAVLALLGVAAAGLWLAILFGTLERRVSAVEPKDVADISRNFKDASWNVAQAAKGVQVLTDALADRKTGVARLLRNVSTITAQLGRTSNEIRLSSIEERQRVAALTLDAQATIHELRDGIGPILAGVPPVLAEARTQLVLVGGSASGTLQETERTVHDLRPQLLGLVGASKIAAGELATSGRDFQKAVPVYIELGKKLGADSDTLLINTGNVAKNIERLTSPRWYDRLIGYGLNGAIMYRSLNPATNLTIKGAQIIAGQK